MKNPWLEFNYRQKTQIHHADLELVEKFNEKLDGSRSASAKKYQLSREHTPLPYFGNLNSKLVILMANPGLDLVRTAEEETPAFRDMFDLARRHELKSDEFVFLADSMCTTPGGQWWRKRLGKIIDVVGIETVKSNIFTAEIHAYKSVNYKSLPFPLPTQEYTFHLVQNLIDNGAYVILGRAKNDWTAAVTGLSSERVIQLNSHQNSFLTPGNMPDGKFDEIIETIKN